MVLSIPLCIDWKIAAGLPRSGALRKITQSKVLPPDPRWPETVIRSDDALGTGGAGHRRLWRDLVHRLATDTRNRNPGSLGAEPGALRWLFVRHGLALAGIGNLAGLAAAAGLTWLMKSVLFGISPVDPLTYTAMPLVLVAATVLASYLPARRAAAVDPVETLRAE
ncbi:MAG TPA: FtsX-like permease family protein [Bryobacteraceae bacterium]|nr:FtsX-like permease family protein [Bryobacteraceae bacterium]